ncbi:unnamed protein product [Linum trigynum]|uniref:Uncharacterized protein n=1 Tax=Linum trigynum TaxID=586398 RepID=A0AAV2GDW5_9ROSI
MHNERRSNGIMRLRARESRYRFKPSWRRWIGRPEEEEQGEWRLAAESTTDMSGQRSRESRRGAAGNGVEEAEPEQGERGVALSDWESGLEMEKRSRGAGLAGEEEESHRRSSQRGREESHCRCVAARGEEERKRGVARRLGFVNLCDLRFPIRVGRELGKWAGPGEWGSGLGDG